MIVDQQNPSEEVKHEENHKSESFLNKLVWKETSYGKWYLGNRECVPAEGQETPEPDIVTFDMGGYELESDSESKVQVGDLVISGLGKHEVKKIEENQVFLQLESEEVPVPLETVKKIINVNFLILGKTKNYVLENRPINLSHYFNAVKSQLAELLTITPEMITLTFKDKEITDEYSRVSSLEINEGDTFLIGFNQNQENCYKRSTSRDYSWYDQKNFIPFIVDKTIVVNAFGFFKHTDTAPAIYDFFLYEIKDDGSKALVLQMPNVKVNPSECDSSMYVKKVNTPTPIILKENVKYHCYVNYKISDMRTYYAYYGTADQTVNGVRFRMLEGSESGYRSSSTSGHMPYIYFKLYNPYDD